MGRAAVFPEYGNGVNSIIGSKCIKLLNFLTYKKSKISFSPIKVIYLSSLPIPTANKK
jgi:hypothetical protein